MKSAISRTITTPVRESATIYYLQITDSNSQDVLTLESETPEFELPEDLEGTYSIKVSFKDKWGREIKGEKPKTITMMSKVPLKNEPVEMILANSSALSKISITPYVASGNKSIDTKEKSTNQTKFNSNLDAKGINISSPLNRIPGWSIGLDILRGPNKESSFNSTELDIGYNWIEYLSGRNLFLVTLNGAYAKTEASYESLMNSDTTIVNSEASTLYVYSKGAAILKYEKITMNLNAMLGGSVTYLRYSAGTSIVYHFKKTVSLGPSIEYAKFENGTADTAIKANMIKLGLNLNLNL